MQPHTAVAVAPVGRILMSLIFVLSAGSKLGDWPSAVASIADKGLPAPDLFLSLAVILELAGGLMMLLGFQARWGAVALLLFLVPVTLVMHNFWSVPQGEQQMQMIHFMKNVTIMGGLLYVVAFGAGAMSVDQMRVQRGVRGGRPSLA